MGQEFCNGCQECTNFIDNEGNFSYTANQPIKYLKNPLYGNLDNSILNIKTENQNDASFYSNNNSFITHQKSETDKNFSLSNKNNDININNIQKINDKNDNIFKSDENKENRNKDNNEDDNGLTTNFYDFMDNEYPKEKNANDNIKNFINNIDSKSKIETADNSFNKYNESNISYKNTNKHNTLLNEKDKKRLGDIYKNNGVKKITSLFRKLLEEKSISHHILYTEYASMNDYQNIQNNLRNDLTVNLIPEKNYIYIGTKFKNKKDGLGLELFTNSNAKYFGRFINDKRTSICRFLINNEDESYYYYGYVKGIHAHGYGWHENHKKLIYYEGMWENSKKEGWGIEINNKDNSEYRGYFSNGKKNGIGYYQWSDNSNYMGEWEDDKLNGYGIYHFQDGSIYKGQWQKNKMDGLGEFTFPGVKTYFGFFEKDKRNGFGILLSYKENKAFIGFWKENKQNGPGKIINNGKIKYGIWENGIHKEKILNKNFFISILKQEELDYLNFFNMDEYKDINQKIFQILEG